MRRVRTTGHWAMRGSIVIFSLGIICSPAFGEAATRPAPKGDFPYVGEVTGDNVYVRSRDGQNWYPTAKLNKGDRVQVHDERFGWLKIRPPKGSFCYIDKTFVIREGEGKGVVKGDNVYVRAGSQIPAYERKKNCVVAQLSKGAEIEILSEHPDGYYRIVPPKDAYYWISRQYVRPVSEGAAPEEPSLAKSAAEADEESLVPVTPPTIEQTTEARRSPTTKAAEPETPGIITRDTKRAEPTPKPKAEQPPKLVDFWQKRLDLVDAEFKAALKRRPLQAEEFEALRKRFEPIANQTQEDVPAQYAKIRLQQIGSVIERIEIRKRLDRITSALDKKKGSTATRPAAAPRREPLYDFQGKLVRSFAFEGRYRIVDPVSGKTTVYLEFPADSEMRPNQYVGRIVKVRVKSKRYDQTARRNVVVPAEIVAAAEPEESARPEAKREAGPPAPAATPAPPIRTPAASANQPADVDTPER